jgi:hypothetical protein
MGRDVMYAVIRTYSGKGAKELFDLLEQRTGDVESVMKSVSGLVSYSLFRTQDGGVSVSVCQDKAGTDESVQKAADWVKKNASNTGVSAPKVSEGTVVVQI